MFCVITRLDQSPSLELGQRLCGRDWAACRRGRGSEAGSRTRTGRGRVRRRRCGRPPSGRPLPRGRSLGCGSRGSRKEPRSPPRSGRRCAATGGSSSASRSSVPAPPTCRSTSACACRGRRRCPPSRPRCRRPSAKPCFSASMPSSRSPRWETCLIWPSATGACPASLRAHISAVSSSSWSGTTRLTRPSSSASSERIASPIRFISSARLGPISRGSRWVPPKPGMIPSLISGWPKTAASAAIRTSQAIATSQPPPKAIELTAAIVATGAWPRSRSRA